MISMRCRLHDVWDCPRCFKDEEHQPYLNGDVYRDIVEERAKQVRKWPQSHDLREHEAEDLAAAAMVLVAPPNCLEIITIEVSLSDS